MPGNYNLKTELNRAIHIMELLSDKENFRNLSERVTFMHYLSKMLRRVSSLLAEHKNNVCSTIVDNSGIDYVAMQGEFLKCTKYFENVSDGGHLRTFNNDYLEDVDDEYREFTALEIIKHDDDVFGESTFYKNSSLQSAHKVLLESSTHLYIRLKNELEVIAQMLLDIEQYDNELPSIVQEKYNELYWDYEENEWCTDKNTFKENILYQIEGYEDILERLNTYRPIYHRELSSYENGCINAKRPYQYILAKHKELSKDDLHNIFYRMYCKRMLDNCIAYFDLVKEPQYKLIFKYKAAEELLTMLMPTIAKYGGFEHSYQYVVVLMVCDDLKLTQTSNSRRGAEYVAYMNPFLEERYWASDSSTYNPYLRKLKDCHFGRLSKGNYYNSDYDDTEFEKLKDVYWYTLSLINKVLGFELPSDRFAGYLHDEHRKVPLIKDLLDASNKPIDRNRLFLLKGVLNGEIKEFLGLDKQD